MCVCIFILLERKGAREKEENRKKTHCTLLFQGQPKIQLDSKPLHRYYCSCWGDRVVGLASPGWGNMFQQDKKHRRLVNFHPLPW